MRKIILGICVLLFMTMNGYCQNDPIKQLDERLSKDSEMLNGIAPSIDLPPTATIDQVVSEVLKRAWFKQEHVTGYKILQIKKEKKITPGYIFVLVSTNLGKKIVLLMDKSWWSRVYDVDWLGNVVMK